MRKSLLLAVIMLIVIASSSYAMKPNVKYSILDNEEWDQLLEYELGDAGAGGTADTVRFGGNGLGLVVRGAEWTWETNNILVTPEFFPDGKPVGNEFLDGFYFHDRTTRDGPSQTGPGHWQTDGTYDFDLDNGAFAHRATFHDNDGFNDGPDPLQDGGAGSWSMWIGTNLYLNPENCGWEQTRGHGNGWSQGFKKLFPGLAGTQRALSFYHLYACEAGFDTDWVEISTDGIVWRQVNPSPDNPNGIFNGGDNQGMGPQPDADGGAAIVTIPTLGLPGQDLWIRFRLATDAFFSDESEGGNIFWGWQVDNIFLTGQTGGASDFEAGMDGWQPCRFEGFDFDLTGSDRPAGRIVPRGDIQCGFTVPCAEACGLEGNVLIFTDPEAGLCGLNDAFQDSYATSPAFSIGGFENADIDGQEGRLVRFDLYSDGGTGAFQTGFSICYVYSPFNANQCPYDPANDNTDPNAPGASEGYVSNWSRTGFSTCDFFGMSAGAACLTQAIDDMSANLPAEADSVILHIGSFAQCRGNASCITEDFGAPYWDNISFGVFDPDGISITNATLDRYTDSFPLAEYAADLGVANDRVARMDGAHSFPGNLSGENPLRFVRADTSVVSTGAQNVTSHLRFRITASHCQGDVGSHPFFAEYPPGVWHEAQMDTAVSQGGGDVVPGVYMTCYHDDDPLNETSWGGETPGFDPAVNIESCDDILADGIMVSGTVVDYFYEIRRSGGLIGTAPNGRNFSALDTTELYSSLWRKIRVLPEMKVTEPGCDPEAAVDRANELLVVHDTESFSNRTRLRALLDSFGLGYDEYLTRGTNFFDQYNTIGRREGRPAQQPRPPLNGATAAQLDPYRCIWYTADTLDGGVTLSDEATDDANGGWPSRDQQALEAWLDACAGTDERLLVMGGYGWASDIDANTVNGTAFLTNRGVTVTNFDYEGLTGDLRRCARITGTAAAPLFDGEFFGTGCPDDIPADVFATTAGGEAVANYVNGNGTPECGDDANTPANVAIIRNAPTTCERTVAAGASFTRTHSLKCDTENCLFTEWSVTGSVAQLVSDLFIWGGKPNPGPIAVDDPELVPGLATQLIGARPNPANPAATISFSLAQKGAVSLRIFDVSGRLVRTLVDDVLEPSNQSFEFVWDGTTNNGQSVGSGVFFYQLDAPGYTQAKKLVILK